jgi:pimeloyl-ACP methyl ester carboxylesterase
MGFRGRTSLAALLTVAALAGCGSGSSGEGGIGGEGDAGLAGTGPLQGARGDVLSSQTVARFSAAELNVSLEAAGLLEDVGAARCDVELRSILHRTVGTGDEPATVSGALLVPSGSDCPGPYPLLAYARGTENDFGRTLADPSDRETALVASVFAAQGYAVVATDYLGYAGSDHAFHPYLHAQTEASTIVDSIRAARAVMRDLDVPLADTLFVTGYSQGGHAAMATHRAIERERPEGLAITASAPMSGPYDLSLNLGQQLAGLPVLVASRFNSSLGGAITHFGDLALPRDEVGLLQALPALRQALQDNSVVDWTPVAPMLLCHGSRDPVVPFADAQAAQSSFAARGAPVTLVDVEMRADAAASLPPPGASGVALSGYHARTLPPLCFRIVRDELFEPLRGG